MKLIPIATLALVALLAGCAISKDLSVADGGSHLGMFRTIDGDITVGSDARIGTAKTIDGDIAIGARSRTRTLATIDGDIQLATGVTVDGSVSTIDGDIRVAEQCSIRGNLRTIDGAIELRSSVVEGDIRVTAGDVQISDTLVKGAIVIKKSSDHDPQTTQVDIGANSSISAIKVEGDSSTVRIRIHTTSKVGQISGAKAERYSD